ncbi:MAG: hypothetical protein COA32_16485 [Fluviicola sp.]|nr:MAG: hypothetical protein COA32_16485 [Fluviicola sp.]
MKEGWKIKTLGEVSDVLNGGTPKTKVKEYWGGNINWITPKDLGKLEQIYVSETPRKITDLGLQKSSAKLFVENSIILSTRAPIGHLAINLVPMATNQGCRGIVPNSELEVHYLFYFLKLNVKLLNDLGTGTTFKELSTRSLESVEVPIPPLAEQKQIVKLLDQAFEAIDQAKANIEKNIANAKELFQSKLNDVFSQEGAGWEEKILPDLVSKSCTLSYGVVQPGDEYENGLPIVRPTDLKNTYVNLDNLKRIDPDKSKSYSKTILKGNELLLCVRGDTGVVSLITDELNGANVTRGIVPILFDENLVRVKFGYFQFISELIQKQIKAKTYGAALMQINIRDVRQLKLNIPSIEVQDKLLPILDEVLNKTELLLHSYTNKLTSLEEFKKSILQKAFSGELTNPN